MGLIGAIHNIKIWMGFESSACEPFQREFKPRHVAGFTSSCPGMSRLPLIKIGWFLDVFRCFQKNPLQFAPIEWPTPAIYEISLQEPL